MELPSTRLLLLERTGEEKDGCGENRMVVSGIGSSSVLVNSI